LPVVECSTLVFTEGGLADWSKLTGNISGGTWRARWLARTAFSCALLRFRV
jgi:hypothetical protein